MFTLFLDNVKFILLHSSSARSLGKAVVSWGNVSLLWTEVELPKYNLSILPRFPVCAYPTIFL